MRQIITNIYTFDELSTKAKETAKQEFLETDMRVDDFRDYLEEDLKNLFPNSLLRAQFSLNSCQGDGLNVYGMLNIEDLRDCILCNVFGDLPDEYKNVLSEEDWKLICDYAEEADIRNIAIPMNMSRYNYSIAYQISFASEWLDRLDDAGIQNAEDLVSRFEKAVRNFFGYLNNYYEKAGYMYLTEISDEEFSDISSANEWEFYETGKLYA